MRNKYISDSIETFMMAVARWSNSPDDFSSFLCRDIFDNQFQFADKRLGSKTAGEYLMEAISMDFPYNSVSFQSHIESFRAYFPEQVPSVLQYFYKDIARIKQLNGEDSFGTAWSSVRRFIEGYEQVVAQLEGQQLKGFLR